MNKVESRQCDPDKPRGEQLAVPSPAGRMSMHLTSPSRSSCTKTVNG
jgi:hypothetical protein